MCIAFCRIRLLSHDSLRAAFWHSKNRYLSFCSKSNRIYTILNQITLIYLKTVHYQIEQLHHYLLLFAYIAPKEAQTELRYPICIVQFHFFSRRGGRQVSCRYFYLPKTSQLQYIHHVSNCLVLPPLRIVNFLIQLYSS